MAAGERTLVVFCSITSIIQLATRGSYLQSFRIMMLVAQDLALPPIAASTRDYIKVCFSKGDTG